eukprot:TRINITY_DN1206_c0_g1_i1.p1 TRINITY_DN1206_c0_g1~~TRINITY_DN1206_c0_g1_i1.p1  ORF type:complete len:220 (+),score=37.88 TRINITY_DN1206_c0_g1_i1:211-870(+)
MCHLNLHQFFQPVDHIVSTRKALDPDQNHIIFLEGPSGTGKKDILWRLHNIGYTVVVLPYLDHAMQFDIDSIKIPEIANEWEQKLVSHLEQSLKMSEHKDQVVFVHRSPFSVNIFKGIDENSNKHLPFSSSTIMCHADEIRIMERVQARPYMEVDEIKKQYIEILQDNDKKNNIEERYASIMEKRDFDSRLNTTSVKQATANILTQCGLDFNFQFKRPS